jgi:ribosomal protein S21
MLTDTKGHQHYQPPLTERERKELDDIYVIYNKIAEALGLEKIKERT